MGSAMIHIGDIDPPSTSVILPAPGWRILWARPVASSYVSRFYLSPEGKRYKSLEAIDASYQETDGEIERRSNYSVKKVLKRRNKAKKNPLNNLLKWTLTKLYKSSIKNNRHKREKRRSSSREGRGKRRKKMRKVLRDYRRDCEMINMKKNKEDRKIIRTEHKKMDVSLNRGKPIYRFGRAV